MGIKKNKVIAMVTFALIAVPVLNTYASETELVDINNIEEVSSEESLENVYTEPPVETSETSADFIETDGVEAQVQEDAIPVEQPETEAAVSNTEASEEPAKEQTEESAENVGENESEKTETISVEYQTETETEANIEKPYWDGVSGYISDDTITIDNGGNDGTILTFLMLKKALPTQISEKENVYDILDWECAESPMVDGSEVFSWFNNKSNRKKSKFHVIPVLNLDETEKAFGTRNIMVQIPGSPQKCMGWVLKVKDGRWTIVYNEPSAATKREKSSKTELNG